MRLYNLSIDDIANLIISAIFATFHFGIDEPMRPDYYIDYFMHGFLFGMVFLQSGSILMTIIIHAIANLLIYGRAMWKVGFLPF